MPLASVIIATWNGRQHLAQCLPALRAQTYSEFEIIVVDNGSVDDTVVWLQQNFPAVQLLVNDHNRGFAAANNQGAAAARGDYIVLLNNDTRPEPTWLAELVQTVEIHPRIGMVASLMLFADRPQMVNSTGICVDQMGITWDRLGGHPLKAVEPHLYEIFGPCAGAALYRRALWQEVGGFDEDFFAYLEDVDLAWRARARGWRAVFNPRARVYHAHSATGQQGSAFKTHWLARNKIYCLLKNYPRPQLWWWALGLLSYDILSLLNATLQGQGRAAWSGRWAGWRAAAQAWRKRQTLPPTVNAQTLWAWLEPWQWPWQVAQRYGHHVK